MNFMEQYLEKGKEVLKILINNGCEAYLIGGAVCNTILGMPFDELDITTNATPDMLKGIFAQAKVEDEGMGSVRLFYSGYQFVINTFLIEEKYKDNRKPLRSHYSKNLHDDLARRDFTINAIAMSLGGKLTDAYRGFEDIQKRKIRTIGNPKVRFTEDPLRMLIALRFVSELGFKIESKTFKAMINKSKLVSKIPIKLMVKEIKRILNGKYFKKTLVYITEAKLYKRIPTLGNELKRLGNKYRAQSVDTFLACAFVSQKNYDVEFETLCEDPVRLKKVVDLAIVTPKSKYDDVLLYSYGLDICLDANYINYLLNKTKKRTKKIKIKYNSLPIKQVCDLKFKGEDIIAITGKTNGDYIQIIVEDMAMKVLKKQIENDYDILKAYTINSLREMEVLPQVESVKRRETYVDDNRYEDIPKPAVNNVESRNITPNFIQEISSNQIPESKIEQIERRVNAYEKTLLEKDEQIKLLERRALEYKLDNDVNNIVGQNLEILKEMNYIDKSTEKIMISRDLKEMYRGLITNVDPKYRSLKIKTKDEEGNDFKDEKKD